MKQKDLLWQWLAVGICCIAFGGSMSAATITQTCTIAAASVPYTQSCTLNLFDPAGGTLTSVVLSLTGVGGDVVPEQTVTNSSTQTFTNSVATVALTMTGPDSIVVTDIQPLRRDSRWTRHQHLVFPYDFLRFVC